MTFKSTSKCLHRVDFHVFDFVFTQVTCSTQSIYLTWLSLMYFKKVYVTHM